MIACGAIRGNDPAPSIATLNTTALADITVQAAVTVGVGVGAELIARYQSNGSYYLGMIQADAAGANFTPYLFKYVAGAGFVQLAAGSTFTAAPGTLRLVVAGASLSLSFGPNAANLSLVASAVDGALATGLTGIRATRGVTFDNYTVG